MEANKFLSSNFWYCFLFFLFLNSSVSFSATISPTSINVQENYIQYNGFVLDFKTNNPLAFANLNIVGTNILSVTNSEGEFSLKVPKNITKPVLKVSFIGYKSKTLVLADLNPQQLLIKLETSAVQLPEIKVISKDANELIDAVLKNRGQNYSNEQQLMTAFYRETIRKNKSYVSLSEAVVEIYKQPINSYRNDVATLFKSRKQADYSKLDTVVFKLMGGPINSLYLDIMKNPDMIFTQDMMNNYEFTFDRSTYMDNRLIYILDFKQQEYKTDPLYYGKLYVDAENLALKSAVFNLDVSNRELSSSMFIIKKPFNAIVYPYVASYRVDYVEKNAKWYYAYSRIELALKINWKKKLFNTNYISVLEMAVTDLKESVEKITVDPKDRLKSTVIISDEADGFSDPSFWGEFNVIEPEKPIEEAIKKIQKALIIK